ncbi:uncharacterized protein L3040_005143 [Drepanopeziza brunnea f. sp. 'multigermtubi']|uniref:uncharacterized protein n=1 Tax=Drepanopeziza brunnea f. sp. 'multigermtubi' TaxID=698441 RepID=UPI002391A2E9|nr:hypothetical protein L3040_005143 [Drepanopeziza brunnea f. sp. 'multigermtubi']
MSRPSLFSRSSRDSSPLLRQHTDAVSLQNLSPRPSSHSRHASPSPPPSFYRDDSRSSQSENRSPSPTPSRTPGRRIQFAGPPPPIATSALLSAQNTSLRASLDGAAVGSRSSSPRSRLNRGGGGGCGGEAGGGGIDPLLGLERRERAIQEDLQLLLDAQSAGLVQGFGGAGAGEVYGGEGSSDAGSRSSTPTARSLQRRSSREQSRGVVPVRQPKGRVLGLRAARRWLLRDMAELVRVKEEQSGVLMWEIERRGEILGTLDAWERKIEGVKGRLSELSSGDGEDAVAAGGEEVQEIEELKIEEAAVENEIREMEDRLAQMKARRRWLGERIKERVNRREARLSSYRGALREVESEVSEFLRRPPIPVSMVMGDEEGFTSLPTSRRTLGMAKEWWTKEVSKLKLRQEEVENEKSALEEGARMWEESFKVVMTFEDDLRKQMASTDAQNLEMLRKQTGTMGEVIEKLSGTVRTAEEKGWNLLICAVGAELEAFKEGEQILRRALGLVVGNGQRQVDVDEESTDGNFRRGFAELQKPLARRESLSSEEDGPNLAELLVDRGDDVV